FPEYPMPNSVPWKAVRAQEPSTGPHHPGKQPTNNRSQQAPVISQQPNGDKPLNSAKSLEGCPLQPTGQGTNNQL
ncbi:hypothetical protein P7K49_035525, partial [Saguinus oedipus]